MEGRNSNRRNSDDRYRQRSRSRSRSPSKGRRAANRSAEYSESGRRAKDVQEKRYSRKEERKSHNRHERDTSDYRRSRDESYHHGRGRDDYRNSDDRERGYDERGGRDSNRNKRIPRENDRDGERENSNSSDERKNGKKQSSNAEQMNTTENSPAEGKTEFKAKESKFSKWGPTAAEEGALPAQPAASAAGLATEQPASFPSHSFGNQSLGIAHMATLYAARKAAELVNRNMGVPGSMTAEEKKKLLWGKKKAAVQSVDSPTSGSNQWESVHFEDKEREERFQKLMGVKSAEGDAEKKPVANLSASQQKSLQEDLERQYEAGLRRRDGRTVGLGL